MNSGFEIFKIVTTNFTITNTRAYNITQSNKGQFIVGSFDSILDLNNVTYENSTVGMINIISSNITINLVSLRDVSDSSSPLQIRGSDSVSITNSQISQISSSNSSYPFLIQNSEVLLMQNVTLSSISQNCMYLLNSRVTSMSRVNLRDSTQGIYASSSQISRISNSNFTSLGNNGILKGGAIYLLNSNASVSGSNFSSNIANQGAGIYFSCSEKQFCWLNVTNSSFMNNYAATSGGAIMYDFYRPNIVNTTYSNNIAQYGPNIGGYAARLKLEGEELGTDITLNNAVSGGSINRILKFSLIDYENQTLVLDNTSTITIKPVSRTSNVINNFLKVNNGVATFDALVFHNTPGANDIMFELTSNAIDLNTVRKVLGISYRLPQITLNFRYCQPGESINVDT